MEVVQDKLRGIRLGLRENHLNGQVDGVGPRGQKRKADDTSPTQLVTYARAFSLFLCLVRGAVFTKPKVAQQRQRAV